MRVVTKVVVKISLFVVSLRSLSCSGLFRKSSFVREQQYNTDCSLSGSSFTRSLVRLSAMKGDGSKGNLLPFYSLPWRVSFRSSENSSPMQPSAGFSRDSI